MTDLTIGIVTYNGCRLLRDCLDSIYAHPPALDFEVIVVDNASADDTLACLGEHYPQARVIANADNRGIAAGNNQCLQNAAGRWVLLLNNDTLALPGMFERLVTFGDAHPAAGAVGGRLLNADGSFQFSYADFPNLWIEFLHAAHLGQRLEPAYPSHADCDEARGVDWICSACLLVRREAAAAVGFVDENFAMYSDETDLQYRLHQAGWKVYFTPDVDTIHLGGQSASHWKRRRLIYRGKLLFFQKHRGALQTAVVRAMFALSSGLKIPYWALMGRLAGDRERAKNELNSNLEVLKLSLQSL